MRHLYDRSRAPSRTNLEDEEGWTEWVPKIPTLRFKEDWEVRIIPPFRGALVRFRVIKGKGVVSVYLDVFDALGWMGKPYWEIYPYEDDVFRCEMDRPDLLLEAIEFSLNEQQKGGQDE